jgi:uncharacterized protein YndB with AHSA1/START domain
MKLDLAFEEVLDASVDVVWRAVTDARLLSRWLMDNDFEPRVGHRFTLRDPPTSAWRGWIECEVLELVAPARMVWSWDGGMAGEIATRVIFELHAMGPRTRLVLRHEGDATGERGESLHSGWTRKMAGLRRVLGRHYACRVAFRAQRERVFDAIATLEGLRGWWTTLVSGSASAGGEILLEFEGIDEHIVMRVEEARQPSRVRWACLEHTSLPDWRGTRVLFELAPRGKEGSELAFEHVGLSPTLECYESCEQGWDHFLASLVALVDRGRGTPFGSSRGRR